MLYFYKKNVCVRLYFVSSFDGSRSHVVGVFVILFFFYLLLFTICIRFIVETRFRSDILRNRPNDVCKCTYRRSENLNIKRCIFSLSFRRRNIKVYLLILKSSVYFVRRLI